jgi:CRISPR/Cas system-associated exonuclease Cas4 (RecB family)
MGDSIPILIDCRRIHCLCLDFLAWHLPSFGETHANLSWACREPQIYSGRDLVEGPDLIIVYKKQGGDKKQRGVPVELKTGNLSERDFAKANHQLFSGAIWLENQHNCQVNYGVLVNIKELKEKPEVSYQRIDVDNIRKYCRPERRH